MPPPDPEPDPNLGPGARQAAAVLRQEHYCRDSFGNGSPLPEGTTVIASPRGGVRLALYGDNDIVSQSVLGQGGWEDHDLNVVGKGGSWEAGWEGGWEAGRREADAPTLGACCAGAVAAVGTCGLEGGWRWGSGNWCRCRYGWRLTDCCRLPIEQVPADCNAGY